MLRSAILCRAAASTAARTAATRATAPALTAATTTMTRATAGFAARRTLATATNDAPKLSPAPHSKSASSLGDPADVHGELRVPGFTVTATSTSATTTTGVPRPIYLDYQATTPTDPRVVDAMLPYFSDRFGNPHSRTHAFGWESEAAVEDARAEIAQLVGADAKEIIFTSGATESNNLAVKGVARFYRKARGKNHIITTQTEHKCVLDSCRVLQEDGFEVTYLPVQQDGRVRVEDVEAALRPETAIVSVMTVNNEIGVIQPIAELGALCRKHKVFFHTDAAQAVGKIPVDVNAMNIDLMSISGHKLYGPKGIGALYVRRRPRVRLEPLISGGGQERGLRSGTVPTPLVVGLGEACRIAAAEMPKDTDHVSKLSERLIRSITSRLTHVARNGSSEQAHAYPGCVNLSFAYVEGESLLMALKGVALSSGSACTSASLEPSYVLRALGASDDMAHSSIRFGIGRFTTEAEVDAVADKVVDAVNRLREMSPLWEMVQEGIDLSTIEWSGH
ncbi:cysteine desulfurase [Blastocladiella emersonii ATCC 22665]|nr:cysteine desulfurase [Blastocladiella emersonii ATCC 22665]